MNNPFKVGDTVYIVYLGNEPVKITHVGLNGFVRVDAKSMNFKFEEVSFSPWPTANHTRPLEDGWWICLQRGMRDPLVRRFEGNIAFYGCGNKTLVDADKYTRVRYLGKNWKEAE